MEAELEAPVRRRLSPLMAAAAARVDDHDEYAKLVRRMNPPR